MTMNINLTQELAQYVQARVKSGRYNSASEVIREALRKQLESEDHRHEFDRLIEEGMRSSLVSEHSAFKQISAYTSRRKKESSLHPSRKKAA